MKVSCGSLVPKLFLLLTVACITNCKIPTICVMWCHVIQVMCVIHELLIQVQACWLTFRLFTGQRSVTRIAGKVNAAFKNENRKLKWPYIETILTSPPQKKPVWRSQDVSNTID